MAIAFLRLTSNTRHQFDQALTIAKYREVDGQVARIWHSKALAIERCSAVTPQQRKEAVDLKFRAEVLRISVSDRLRISIPDHSGSEDDAAYDCLVCGYFR